MNDTDDGFGMWKEGSHGMLILPGWSAIEQRLFVGWQDFVGISDSDHWLLERRSIVQLVGVVHRSLFQFIRDPAPSQCQLR
jgi:hypothetical protein